MPNVNYLHDAIEDFTYACEFRNQLEMNRIRRRIMIGLQRMVNRSRSGQNVRPVRNEEYVMPVFVFDALEQEDRQMQEIEAQLQMDAPFVNPRRGGQNYGLLFSFDDMVADNENLNLLADASAEVAARPQPARSRHNFTPKCKVVKKSLLDTLMECLICQEEKTKKDLVATTCCSNHYCGDCLERWLDSKNNRSCPTCRLSNTKCMTFRARRSNVTQNS